MRMPLPDPTDEAAVDVEQVSKMVDMFLERGFTYFDTAWIIQIIRNCWKAVQVRPATVSHADSVRVSAPGICPL